MTNFEITITETINHYVKVSAPDVDTAERMALGLVINGPETEYFTESVSTAATGVYMSEDPNFEVSIKSATHAFETEVEE